MSEESDIMDQLRLHWAATDKLVGRLTSISLTRIQAEDAGLPPPDANSKEAIASGLAPEDLAAPFPFDVKPVDEDKERADFEAWASEEHDDDSEYAWQAWLERASRG